MRLGLPILLLALAATAVAAQNTPVVLITDDANDQAVTSGQLVVTPPDYDNVDLLEVAVQEADVDGNKTIQFLVTTSAAMTETQRITLRFGIEKGPTSLFESVATGKDYALVASPTTVTGATNATASTDGNVLTITVPLASLEATGGDLVANMTALSTDANTGQTTTTFDDSSASDNAPNTGAAAPYTFNRVAPQAVLRLASEGGSILTGNATFSGTAVTTEDQNADIRFDLRVFNDGTDPETVGLAVQGAPQTGVNVILSRAETTLLPGEDAAFNVVVRLANVLNNTSVDVVATGSAGGSARMTLAVQVNAPSATSARTPVPAALGFLTPAVESLGLDGPLGAYAELALLAVLVLLLVVLIFLLLFLRRGPWVRVQLNPRHAVVAPGSVAQFQVEFVGKGDDRSANARVEGEGWPAGLSVADRSAAVGETLPIQAPKGQGLPGVVRVEVPHEAEPKTRRKIHIEATPVVDGEEVPKRRGRATAIVQAGLSGDGAADLDRLDVHLVGLQHDPVRPAAGATVVTTATLRNAGSAPARMRVVLLLDGKSAREERVEIAPDSSVEVRLPWTATAGSTKVKVQAFLA